MPSRRSQVVVGGGGILFLSLSGLLLQRRRRSEDDRIKASASSFKCGWVSEDGMASNQKKRRRVKGVKKNKSKKKECFSF